MSDDVEILTLDEAERRETLKKLNLKPIGFPSFEGKPVPGRRWLVEGLIPVGSVTLLTGDGGLGKSLLGLQLLASCATGKPWLGHPVRQCKGFGFFCEDDEDEIHRRLDDITRSMDVPWPDLEGAHFVSRVGENNILMSFPPKGNIGTTTEVYDWLLNYTKNLGAKLVIIDTAADVYGGEENWRAPVRQFVNSLRKIALETDGSVLLMAHPSVNGMANGSGISGSTAWNNTVRSRLYLTRPKESEDGDDNSNIRVLKGMKSNYGAKAGEVRLRWTRGAFEVEQGQSMTDHAANASAVDRVFMEGMFEMVRRGQTVCPLPKANNYAPSCIEKLEIASGIKRRALEAAMDRLLTRGKLKIVETGRSSQPRRELVINDVSE